MLKLLKKIDVFSGEVYTFSTDTNSHSKKKKYTRYHGSILGGILTITFGLCTLGYLANQIEMMTHGHFDNYNT